MLGVRSLWLTVAALMAASGCGAGSSATTNAHVASAPAEASGSSSASVAAETPHETAVGEAPPEFPSVDPNRWVNGTPTTLASLHGDVVLVESWHRL